MAHPSFIPSLKLYPPLDKVASIAYNYGFRDANKILSSGHQILQKQPLRAHGYNVVNAKKLPHNASAKTDIVKYRVPHHSVLSECLEKNILTRGSAVQLFHHRPFFSQKKSVKKNLGIFTFELFGVTGSIAEAFVINVAYALALESGMPDAIVNINSAGDRFSSSRFLEECRSFFKRYGDGLHRACRQALSGGILKILSCEHDKCEILKEVAPKSMNFLTEESTQHLKEILEYLEVAGVPYRINERLLGRDGAYSKIIFEIETPIFEKNRGKALSEKGKRALFCCGGRYDELSEEYPRGKHLSAVGATVFVKNYKENCHAPQGIHPIAFFIQIGEEARRKSFLVTKLLCCIGIPIVQSMQKQNFTEQIALADKLGVPYLIIMGCKEAADNTVIVRKTDNRFQEVVTIPRLVEYIKAVFKTG